LKYLNKPFSLAPDFILQYPQYKVLTSDKFLKDTIEALSTKAKSKIPFNQKVAHGLAKYSYPIALRNIED
jgi:hypothetical protein